MTNSQPSRRRAIGLIGGMFGLQANRAGSATTTMIEEPWSHAGLAGTFGLPTNGPARGPAVLIIAGSGPTDRNGNGPLIATDAYRLLAAGLAAYGVRSLRYDKRGVGESAGLMTREEDLRFDDMVNDAMAAARALSQRADVSSIVLAGHSEGGLIAMRVAPAIAVSGLVLLAAPGRPLADILRAQFRSAPVGDDLRGQALRIIDALARGETVADVPAELAPVFRPSVQPYLVSALNIDPRIELAQLSAPVLIVHGARDVQLSLEHRDALAKARPDARVVTARTANHVLKTAPSDRDGNLKTYTNRSLPLDPAILPPIVLFIEDVS